MKVIAVQRDEAFSPNSAEKDEAILAAVCEGLRRRGVGDVRMVAEGDLSADDEADVFLSMARLPRTLALLEQKEKQGARVLNSAFGVVRCGRSLLNELLLRHGIPVPATDGADGYWLKRGDQAAQSHDDVVFCKDRAALAAMQASFVMRGVTDWVVQAHVPGDLVKFYAVRGGFFRCYYPADDGMSKYGDEARNGAAHHYAFEVEELRQVAETVSVLTGVDIYGGDAIVREDGGFCLIDFNEWPSFSRCRAEAAQAVCDLIIV